MTHHSMGVWGYGACHSSNLNGFPTCFVKSGKRNRDFLTIMQLVDKIAYAVENKETTIGVYLDLSKAFDTIDHNILLYKLELWI